MTYVCKHCGAEVWWGLPRPDDPCYECGKPIAQDEKPAGKKPDAEVER